MSQVKKEAKRLIKAELNSTTEISEEIKELRNLAAQEQDFQERLKLECRIITLQEEFAQEVEKACSQVELIVEEEASNTLRNSVQTKVREVVCQAK